MSVLELDLARVPYAVVDVETTGLSAHYDRVVELAVVVVAPGEAPRVVLDTLLHPGRPVAATEIHGLDDAALEGAPPFAEVADALVAALANRVLVSHNVYFDLAFLRAELERCQVWVDVPHLCSMLLARVADPTLPRLSLAHACARWGVTHGGPHAAVHDAMAAAMLLQGHVRRLRAAGVRTFGDLAARGDYQFLQSFGRPMLSAPASIARARLKPRGDRPAPRRRAGIAEYMETLLDAVADLHLTDAEVGDLRALPSALGLAVSEVRAVHAKVFFGMLARYVEDARVDDPEARNLAAMRGLLSQLGWAPGDPVGA